MINYRKDVVIAIFVSIFCSCTVKTFTISESDIVGPVKYDLSKDSTDWSTCSISEQKKACQLLQKL